MYNVYPALPATYVYNIYSNCYNYMSDMLMDIHVYIYIYIYMHCEFAMHVCE